YGEDRRGLLPDEATRPPEPGSMHMMCASNGPKRDVREPQPRVRARIRDECAPPGGPGQGHRAPGGSAWIDTETHADSVLPIPVAQELRVRIRSHGPDEGRRGAQARHLEREVGRVPPRQRIEPGNLRLHIARREILHRGRDQLDNSVADRDDARRSRTHPSRPPKSLPLQLLDDELVVRRPTASRAEQTSVRITDRVGSFPPAVAAQSVRARHHPPQNRYSRRTYMTAEL